MHSTTLTPSESFTPKHTEPTVVCQDERLMQTLTPTQKAVMACINTVCGVKVLASTVGISHRHARRIVRQLAEMGVITITAHAKGGRGNHAAFRSHVRLLSNEDMAAPSKGDISQGVNEDIPDGVSREAYATATQRMIALNVTWDALRLMPIKPFGTFIYFPNGDSISPDGALRVKTRTPDEIDRAEQAKRLARTKERLAALHAQTQNADMASGSKGDTDPQPVAAVLDNQRARTYAGALDPFPYDSSPRSIQSSLHDQPTKKDDSQVRVSIPSPASDLPPRARTRGFAVTDEMVQAVEREAKIFGKRAEIRALIAEVGQDFYNCHWSIPIIVRKARAAHFAKYPNSFFEFRQLQSWLRNKQRDARREQHRDLTPAVVYQPAKAS